MKVEIQSALYRKLPSVDDLLRDTNVAALIAHEGHAAVTDAARTVLMRLREEISSGSLDAAAIEVAVAGIAAALERALRQGLQPSLRPVINATGVVLHTNLGRAPLSQEAVARIREIAAGYSNLEFDIEKGERGQRDFHADRLFSRLFSQELGEASEPRSTLVVNNNAAAVLLALNTLAEGAEAIVSRGELVEIGGSFRIPEVMKKANVTLREVGTTNRTRISDYESAITEKTRVLLRVHRSNFQMVGFTEQPALSDLVALGHKRRIPVVEDLGSGALFDLNQLDLNGELTVYDSLRAGVDVVTYSGDKLLGGPQAGLITGRRNLITRIRENPLFRALRVDKLTYAALEATLLAYVRQKTSDLPALAMMQMSSAALQQRAQNFAGQLQQLPRLHAEVISGESVIGGGAAPGARLATWLLAVTCDGQSAEDLARHLRMNPSIPIIARVEEGRVLLDLRTVFPEQEPCILECIHALAQTDVAGR